MSDFVPRSRSLCAGALVAVALAAACDRAPLEGPPVLRPGRDVCAECGMSVMEDRCSAATLVDRDDGRGHLLFDDIGCMLDHERDGATPPPIARFVHDHATGEWIEAERAVYLMSESIRTPMDSWLVARATMDAARDAQARHGGVVLGWSELDTVRRQWLRDRRMPRKE
ncbi:MAG: hypothetical protein FJ253_00210 [Phycisphaerae bacterium]|nr:hypothetical protein [Phycisphaerae bacterium]